MIAELMKPEVITALLTVLTVCGGGAKWLLMRVDAKAEAERKWQADERGKVEQAWKEKFALLEQHVSQQDKELHRLRMVCDAYIRHVGVLEGFLRAANLPVPPITLADGTKL